MVGNMLGKGQQLSINELSGVCGTNRQVGTSDAMMEKGLRAIGARYSIGKAKDTASLAQFLEGGGYIILRTLTRGIKHWIVVYGTDGEDFLAADPWLGQVRYGPEELVSIWKPRDYFYFEIPPEGVVAESGPDDIDPKSEMLRAFRSSVPGYDVRAIPNYHNRFDVFVETEPANVIGTLTVIQFSDEVGASRPEQFRPRWVGVPSHDRFTATSYDSFDDAFRYVVNKYESRNQRGMTESGPTLPTLKKHQEKLTDRERQVVMAAGATWSFGKDGAASPAVKKSVVNGKTWYWSNTHRCYQADSTLKAAIKAFHDVVEPSS